jgi:hypothetical protein
MLLKDSPVQAGAAKMKNFKVVCAPAALLAGMMVLLPRAEAQSTQEPSVADAARQAREQKKAAAKPSQVITNDTLAPLSATPAGAPNAEGTNAAVNNSGTASQSVVMAPVSEPGTGSGSAAPAAANGLSAEEMAQNKAKADALKQQIAEMQKQLDLQKRELDLASDDYYSHPDFSKDTAGKAKLDEMLSTLQKGRDELAELKAKLVAEGALEDDKTPPAKP